MSINWARYASVSWCALVADGERAQQGDLGHILDKALMPLPADRYAGVIVMANDLSDWLARRPAQRRRQSPRAPEENCVAMALAAGHVGGRGRRRGQWCRNALREARAKVREAETSRQTTQFISLFQGADPTVARGAKLSAQDLLDQGSARLRSMSHLSPPVRARMLQTISATYTALGDYDRALALATEAFDLRRADAASLEMAESLDQVGEVLRLKADYAGAEPLLREALDLRSAQLARDDPAIIESGALGCLAGWPWQLPVSR